MRLTSRRARALQRSGNPGPEGSVGKLAQAEIYKRIWECGLEVMGSDSLIYEAGHELEGHTFTGSPAQVIDKILYQHEIFGHERFLLQFIVGSLAHSEVMRAIELLGTQVAPVVRAEIAKRSA